MSSKANDARAREWIRAGGILVVFSLASGSLYWLGFRLADAQERTAKAESQLRAVLVEKQQAEKQLSELRRTSDDLRAENALMEEAIRKLSSDRDVLLTELSVPALEEDIEKLRKTLANRSPKVRAMALYLRGEEVASRGDEGLAAKLFEAAVQEDGHCAPALNRLGLAAAKHDFGKAERLFRKADASDPTFLPPSFNLILLYLANNHTSKRELEMIRAQALKLRNKSDSAPKGTIALLKKFDDLWARTEP